MEKGGTYIVQEGRIRRRRLEREEKDGRKWKQERKRRGEKDAREGGKLMELSKAEKRRRERTIEN
jgi:hypothetical protein